MGKCQSCGMAMESENIYCQYCTDAQGNLLPREAVEEKMIQFYVSAMNNSYQDAAAKVKDLMSKMPAWQNKEEVNPTASEASLPVDEPMPASPLSEAIPEPPAPEPLTEATAEPIPIESGPTPEAIPEDVLQPSSAEPQALPEGNEEQAS